MDFKENPNVKDRYYTAHVLLYAMGTIGNLASHFFTTATDYWMYKFRDVNQPAFNSSRRTDLQKQFTSVFSIASNISHVIFFISAFLLINKIKVLPRVIGSLTLVLVIFAITLILAGVDTDDWQFGFFIVTILSGVFLTGACGIFAVSLIEIIIKFPPRYFPSLVMGQALTGILSALIQIFAIGVGADHQTIGLIFFGFGFLFVLLTILGFLHQYYRSEFVKYYIFQKLEENKTQSEQKQKLGLIKAIKSVTGLIQRLKWYLLSMGISMGATVMIHPAVTALVVSVDKDKTHANAWNDKFFVPVITFLLYNICDYLAREVAKVIKKPTNGLILVFASCLRFGFIPLILYCNVQSRNHLPVVFDKDYIYVIVIMALAITNGYTVNLSIILMPQHAKQDELQIASVIITIIMIVFMALFSLMSAVFVSLV